MPTYSFMCQKCGAPFHTIMSIRDYCAAPPAFVCCGQTAERFFEVVPGLALSQLANDRHYADLRAPDGTDISSRAKHQAYMKANNLTTADDFTNTWKREAEVREARMAGEDPQRKHDIVDAIHKLGG